MAGPRLRGPRQAERREGRQGRHQRCHLLTAPLEAAPSSTSPPDNSGFAAVVTRLLDARRTSARRASRSR